MRGFKQPDFIIYGQVEWLFNDSVFFDGSLRHDFGGHASGVLAFSSRAPSF
jgi:hypothetical protein